MTVPLGLTLGDNTCMEEYNELNIVMWLQWLQQNI